VLGFKDAPDAAMQAVIARATEGGLRGSLAHRCALLVLPQDGEEDAVRDNSTGEASFRTQRMAGKSAASKLR